MGLQGPSRDIAFHPGFPVPHRSPMHLSVAFAFAAGMVLLASCGSSSGGSGQSGSGDTATRTYAMGFSPWPYDATTEAVDWTYDHLASDGDMISEHSEEGVPWPEMLAGNDFTGTWLAEVQGRKDRLVPGGKVLVQINALDVGRSGLAAYRSDTVNDALPTPWDGYAFNHADVKTAYLNYARKMADFFDPDWLMIGVEVNLLIRNSPGDWAAYIELLQHVRAGLATSHPTLRVGVSV